MPVHVSRPTPAQLLARRQRLLDRAGLGRDELDAQDQAGILDGQRANLLDEIRTVEWLLGDDLADADILQPAPQLHVGARPRGGGHVAVVVHDGIDVRVGTRIHDTVTDAVSEATDALQALLAADRVPPSARDCCRTCRDARLALQDSVAARLTFGMLLCPACGNKRCPQATDHRLACSGSNESGQPGSAYTVAGPNELTFEDLR